MGNPITPAGSNPPTPSPMAGDEAQPRVEVTRTEDGTKRFRIVDPLRVEGRIQKPTAIYVMQRSPIGYDFETLKEDFLQRVVDAASDPVFNE